MIGDLYNAANVVVGQAAVLFAPLNTTLPNLLNLSFSDPFSLVPWQIATFTINGATAPVTAFTITYNAVTTSSLTVAGLTTALITTAVAALTGVGVGNVVVTGTAATGWVITLQGAASQLGALTVSGTGGTPTVVTGVNPLWVPCGATDQGWQFGTNKSTTDINIEEQSTQVGTQITSQKVTLNGALSEEISSNLALAYNATLTTVASSTTTPGYDELNPTDTVLSYAVAMISQRFDGKPKINYAPAWTQLSNVETSFRRATAKRMYPVSFSTICKPGQIRMLSFTAPHS